MPNYDDSHRPPDVKVSIKPAELMWRIPQFFPDMDSSVHKKLFLYLQELIRFNGRINLISTRSEPSADIVHIADAILASKMILKSSDQREIYDIGTGNGLPGVVMSILAPDRQIVFLDKDARKIEFVKHICSRLEIKNAFFLHQRVEELDIDSIHCAVSRGFASISKSLLLLRKAMANDAEYYHMKSDSWTREIADIPTQICSYWKPSLVGTYTLPGESGANLSIVLTKKKK